MKPRKILHLDLDAFFCSVEELNDPSLIGTPFAVGGSPTGRGVITSASYAARQFGVRSAMPSGRALSLCPQIKLVRGSYHLYGEYSDKVMAILDDVSPLVEKVSVDEAFIDVTDLPQPLEHIASLLQHRIKEETKLPCSIGGGTNKLVAKVANDFGKSSVRTGLAPQKITIIPPGQEAVFFAPLDIQAIWGVGPKTAQRLKSRGIQTVGQLANLTEKELTFLFGKFGPSMKTRALGISHSPVSHGGQVKSISNETTFSRDISDDAELKNRLRGLCDKVGYRLRKANLAGKVVQIKVRAPDFSTITRQAEVATPTQLGEEVYEMAARLLDEHWQKNSPVRLIGVGVSTLSEPHRQLSLWDDDSHKREELAQAVDSLKDKYGKNIILRASNLKNAKKSSWRED